MDQAADIAASMSPTTFGVILAIGGVLFAGMMTALVWLGRKLAFMIQAKMSDFDKAQSRIEGHIKAQADKDAALVERYSVLAERLKFASGALETIQDRLREGARTFGSLQKELAAEREAREKFERELTKLMSGFEQEVHNRVLTFADQWQRTLVDLANKFVSREAFNEYRTRHEQDHGRLEVRMARQEELTEKLEQTATGIKQELEGGIHMIAALLAKHITVGAPKVPSEGEG